MVLALKPFGCLPSMQSDAVQASLVERFPEVSFLPIETSADGEIHAYSRVQMALSEAKAKASLEFEQALKTAHHSLDEIRSFVRLHSRIATSAYTDSAPPGHHLYRCEFLLLCRSTDVRRTQGKMPSRPHSQRERRRSSVAIASDSFHTGD